MLAQPNILQVQGGTTAWQPIGQNLWPSADQLSDAISLQQKLIALGITDATVYDVTAYKDAQGNPRNDLPGLFMYLETTTRFYAVRGTLVEKDAQGKVISEIPIAEYTGQINDRQVQPNAFFDKIATSTNPYPNGPILRILPFAAENYATLYWSAT